MCSPATCRKCGKVTYTGCGQHVAQVMANVPKSQQCGCTEDKVASEASLLGRIFGQ